MENAGSAVKNKPQYLNIRLLSVLVLLTTCALIIGCARQSTNSDISKSKADSATEVKTEREPLTEQPPSPDKPEEKPFVREFFRNNKTIHFLSSDPPNNALLPHPPEMVTIRFSSDLGGGSFIKVTVDGKEVSTGQMILPVDNRSMSVRINPYIGTGNYRVFYTAYWSDGSYCEGSFGFSVQEPG